MPAALLGKTPNPECLSKNGSSRGRLGITVASDEKDEGAKEEDDGGEHISEVEADVFLGVGHTDLTNESTDIDEQIEVL